MIKRNTLCFLGLFLCYSLSFSQTIPLRDMRSANVGIKSNLIYDAFTNFNLGMEFRLSRKHTLDISADYNPWTFSDNKKFKHILVQPEFRYWICDPFNRHFIGIHAHYANFNVGGINLPLNLYPNLKENRYEGWLVGGGFSYGYQWYLGKRWSMEATLGLGYAYIKYDRFDKEKCGEKNLSSHKNYIGPTKVGLALIYLIK